VLPSHGFLFEADDAWVIPAPWGETDVRQDHGVQLDAPSMKASLHVRSLSKDSGELSAGGVLACLKEQQWGVDAVDVVESSNGPVAWAAGTFENARVPGGAIREWFITNGERLANFGLIGTPDAVRRATAACEQMVRSLRFD
jgi:hypothetical protein